MQRLSHKRAAAGSIAQASTSHSSQHQPKKARFVEPSEDPQEFADQVDSALETPSAKRKGRVKREGYDSDSSDDGEGVVFSRRKSGAGADGGDAAADDDDDMFAMGEKEQGDEEAGGGKEKEEKFLRLGDIEGQEFGGHSASDKDSDEDDEPEDEDDAERRNKAGMGYEISSFNMREEMEEGKFAEDGTYVRSFDPHGVHDRWMDDVDEKAIKMAKRAKRRQDREQKEKMKEEERDQAANDKEALEKQLLPMLKKGETVLESLQRLGAKAKKTRSVAKPNKHNKSTSAMDVDKDSAKATSDIDLITHLASSLMSLGDADIYSRTYEELVRSVRSAGKEDPSWVPPSADVKYEFKWDVPGSNAQSGEVFGPYSEQEMQVWFKAAYFGAGGEKVKIRKTGGDWGDWDDVVS